MLKKLSISRKMFLGFGVTILITTILYGIAIFNLFNTVKKYNDEIESNKIVISSSIRGFESVINFRIKAIQNDARVNNENLNEVISEMNTYRDEAIKSLENYKKIYESLHLNNSSEIELINNTILDLKRYNDLNNDYYKTLLAGDLETLNRIDIEMTEIWDRFFKICYETPERSLDKFVQQNNQLTDRTKNLIFILLLSYVITLILIIWLAISISKNIAKPIKQLQDATNEVLNGNINVNLPVNYKDEIGVLSEFVSNMIITLSNILEDIQISSKEFDNGKITYKIDEDKYNGIFKDTAKAINNTIKSFSQDMFYVIEKVKDFENGEFDKEIKEFIGEKSIVSTKLKEIQKYLKNVSNDIASLINVANEGNLEFRLDTSKYIGEWKEITDGLNLFAENVIIPIKDAQNAINQYAACNFDYKMTNEYKGEFDNIKKALNFMSGNIYSYINEISIILNKMAEKDFNLSIDREYLGDFKTIRESVNFIVENFNLLVKDIISSAEEVSSGAKQISHSSVSLADGATQQASAVDELNSIINMISEQSAINTENSEKANKLAIETKESAAISNKQMDDMLLAMEEISIASNSISNIIKVIDDIAFQTNILALNAAVEAAKETTELIKSTVEKVAEGSKITNLTAETLSNIITEIDEISILINSCAVSSRNQEKSIEQIIIGIKQIASVTQENTATSEQSEAAAEHISTQADIFYSSVSEFKLKES